MAYKDGVFLSPHKMVGGPGCSGVLAARLELFSWADRNSSTTINEIIPSCPAGGTVDFVSKDRHKYVKSVLSREEAGTPNILATIRTGLVLRLQEIMDPRAILAKEYRLAASIYERLARHGCIEILGTPTLDRVAVFSAMVTIPVHSTLQRPLQIHYSLLSMMMNDFFGIEMRGGCMCAGPYGSKLLGFGPEKVAVCSWEMMTVTFAPAVSSTRKRREGRRLNPLNTNHEQRKTSINGT
jgi:selenocysteine lyase/cysteine desulfurase